MGHVITKFKQEAQQCWHAAEMHLPQLAADATRSSFESLCTTVDLSGTGTGLVALAAAAVDGDVLCDVCSTHGEQRFIGDSFSVATLDCILSNRHTR